MKKIIFIITHFAVIFAILITIGVTSKTDDTGSVKFTGVLEENITLHILDNDTAIKQGYLKELLDAFNAKYKEYGITAIDANMDEYTNLDEDGPFGLGPDVVYQANDKLMKNVDGHHIMHLPENGINDVEQYSDEAIAAFQREVNGEKYTFGIPVNIQSSLMYYRKDLLPADWKDTWDDNKNDVPDMLENWNDMYNFSEQLYGDYNDNTWGYMRSYKEPYFSTGFLLSYGAYIFGQNDTDTFDIGFSKSDSYKGARVLRQLASLMDQRCVDDSITRISYSELAKGHFFATITTPDVYTMFVTELQAQYGKDININDYLGVYSIPKLPKSGDLTEENPELIPNIMMGGVHAYGISSYTKYPNASLAFINFATTYEQIYRRSELLGIAAARTDVADDFGGLSKIVNQEMADGVVQIMPSITGASQIWAPLETLFTSIAKDPFRAETEQAFLTDDDFKTALGKVDTQIYNAIHILQ